MSAAKGNAYTSGEQVKAALRNQDADALTKALVLLRNQLSFSSTESLTPQDRRLILAQQWLVASPGAQDIFSLWENAEPRQTAFIALLISVLATSLSLLTTHYPYHSFGHPIVKKILEPTYTRVIKGYIGGANHDLILASLKLYSSVSKFAGGRDRKTVLEVFPWELKSLPKLMNMRRKNKVDDPLDKPDIRTLYTLLLLSFIEAGSSTASKTLFLEQHREQFTSIFKGLHQDPYAVIRRVLESCWSGMWGDSKLKRTLKITVFNEVILAQLCKIYDRDEDDETGSPADVVHHFLLAICTHPGAGICFKDNGWYPREVSEDQRAFSEDKADTVGTRGKIFNKILGNVLKNLKANDDLRQQELALKILAACPELVAGFWSSAGLTLEPRLSSRWFTNISLFGSIISLPIPVSSFLLSADDKSTLYRPAPPPLSNIIENIFPSSLGKIFLTKALQPTSKTLVQHSTALALCKCLVKYRDVVTQLQNVSEALEENAEDGLWAKRIRDLEREARRRIPEFQVVLAFSQRTNADNGVKMELLTESSHRLLWLYHHCLPELVAEARFDVGKLLAQFLTVGGEDGRAEVAGNLVVLKQLHILRILEASDQFIWTAKYGSSKHSSLYMLMKMMTETAVPAIHNTAFHLIKHLLASSILYQHNADEVDSWLQSLPIQKTRSAGAEAADGAPLTDEGEGVLAFLDECVQRCIKTPYRYIEEMQTAVHAETHPSPLMMTLKEQISAKLNAGTLSASDTLALATFVRKLVFQLHTSTLETTFTRYYVAQMDDVFSTEHLFSEFPLVTSAVRREVEIMQYCLGHLELPTQLPAASVAKDIREFLKAVEGLEPPAQATARQTSAYELVDWIRLIDQPIRYSEITRLVLIIHRYHPFAVHELAYAINPQADILWDGPIPVEEMRPYVSFDWLFVSCSEEQLLDQGRREYLVEAAFRDGPSVLSLKRVFCQIEHSLSAALRDEHLTMALLDLLHHILVRSAEVLGQDAVSLKDYVFLQCPSIRVLSTARTLSGGVDKALQQLVNGSLKVSSAADRRLVADTALYWMHLVKTRTGNLEFASTWVSFLPIEALLELARFVSEYLVGTSSALVLLDKALDAVKLHAVQNEETKVLLTQKIDQLMALRSHLPQSTVVEDVLSLALEAMQPMFVDGLRFDARIDTATIASAVAHWNLRFQRLPAELLLSSFLEQEAWSSAHLSVIRALLYKTASTSFSAWLQDGEYKSISPTLLAPVLHTFLDVASSRQLSLEAIDRDHWKTIVVILLPLCASGKSSVELRRSAAGCLALLFRLLESARLEISALLAKQVSKLPSKSVTVELLDLGRSVGSSWPTCVNALAEHGAQWAVDHLGDENPSDIHSQECLKSLITLVDLSSSLKSHVVESLLTVIPQSQLSNPLALKLLHCVLSKVQFKPLIINRVVQSIVQHHRFVKFCSFLPSNESSSTLRDSLVHVLHALFNTHPTNTCQITHVTPLIPVYYGTASLSDRRLLSIFRLFETQRKVSIGVLFDKWDASPDGMSNSSLEAIQSLDANMLHRTCLQFPKWRIVEDQVNEREDASALIYDPLFIILLVSQMLAECPPQSAFAWIEFFRTNAVGVLIRALSAKDDHIRELALCALTALWTSIEWVDLQERLPVQHILVLLRNAIPRPSAGEPCKRLATYATLLLSHSLRGIFYPYQFTYPLTARFLLQRPELDTTDVPMLFGMLYSSSDDWRKERMWMVHLLSDGLVGSDDWKVFKRRHTWDLLASIFQSSTDKALRKGILEVLAALTCIPQAASSLVLKSGLIPWIEMQVMNGCDEEAIPWLKVLENVMIVVDVRKIEASTNGQWRSVIARCLQFIIDSPSNRQTNVLSLSVRVLLRLSLLSHDALLDMQLLVQKSFAHLRATEDSLSWEYDAESSARPERLPHSKVDLFECHTDHWGQVVEGLWRISMSFAEKTATWDELSSRMLMWRAMSPQNATAEWMRVEVVKNLAG